jgi:hypothetical protein
MKESKEGRKKERKGVRRDADASLFLGKKHAGRRQVAWAIGPRRSANADRLSTNSTTVNT